MSKLYPTDDEMYTRTTVNLLAKDEHAQTLPLINNYGVKGFTVSGDTVIGPIAILPRCLLNWNVSILFLNRLLGHAFINNLQGSIHK